jgi:hypothetical protein
VPGVFEHPPDFLGCWMDLLHVGAEVKAPSVRGSIGKRGVRAQSGVMCHCFKVIVDCVIGQWQRDSYVINGLIIAEQIYGVKNFGRGNSAKVCHLDSRERIPR